VVVKTRETYKLQARVLKAMANESRLLVIDRLTEGECSAGELVALVGTDASTVSKHLSVLRASGIVEDRRAGTTVYYRLLTPCVLDFLACATRVLKARSGESDAERST
jgi:ArsR family transcriptional regulator